LRAESEPFVLEDPRIMTAGELDGVIARPRIDDDDLVGERDAREAILQAALPRLA
jgi:hypothetical protein